MGRPGTTAICGSPWSTWARDIGWVFSDLRGCGRSTQGLPDDQYTPDAVVDDLTRLLDVLEVEQADVLGFSYGGLIAQRRLCPDQVAYDG